MPYAPEGTFAAGWNDCCAGKPFNGRETAEWRFGWQACQKVPIEGRVPFNQSVKPPRGRKSA